MASSLSGSLEIVVRTDPGRVRGHNEDAVFANPNIGLAILADGMGGYNAGEVASGMTTMCLSTELEADLAIRSPHETDPASGERWGRHCLRERIATANSAILHAAESQPQYAGMGTTLVTTLFFDNSVTVAHIGDSRLYRLRGEVFSVLTRDHSLLQEQIESGMITPQEARFSQNRNLVTRAVGVDPAVEADIGEHLVLPGDIYLLCSDGLNDMVADEEIGMTLKTLSANLDLAATRLIQMANDNGGRDNVSVILIKVLREFPAVQAWWVKLIKCFKQGW